MVGQLLRKITKPEVRAARELMPLLRELKRRLEAFKASLSAGIDPLPVLIDFFNTTSPWQDHGVIGRLVQEARRSGNKALFQALVNLDAHIDNSGRKQHGWNRTEPGEAVTADRVFLGDIFGIWTKTVACWQKRKVADCDDLKPDGRRTTLEIIRWQARHFMESHLAPMIELIDEIDRLAA